MKKTLPFSLSKTESFYDQLNDWIGDVFYDVLPEKGFEIRDEQIYMAFQLLNAYKNKQVIFAEAGVGTGKTLVYLLYAFCYARYTGKPAIIACADETLIEQLVKEGGDIQKLEKALDLSIDVRLAKSREQYLCLKKLNGVLEKTDNDHFDDVFDQLPKFVHSPGSMNKFDVYGDRKDYSALSDEEWTQIGWDPLQDCFSCDLRHRCGQTLNREYYRKSEDLIICSHDFYMEHVWTKESRVREGQLPLLPEASSIIFDEGHLLEFASQKALTYRITWQTLNDLLEKLLSNDVREKTLNIIEDVLALNDEWFDLLKENLVQVEGSERMQVNKAMIVLKQATRLKDMIDDLLEELVLDAEMYVINDYDLKIVEEYLDQIVYSLKLFIEDDKGIVWFEESLSGSTLVIMPRLVEDILREEVFSQKLPFIFSSATLSNNKDFTYISKSLGIDTFSSLSVESPFDYEENMKVEFIAANGFEDRIKETISSIKHSNGKTLVLFNSKSELETFKEKIKNLEDIHYPVLFEGDKEISTLVQEFQSVEESFLCSYHLWEGLDIPGSSLSNVVLFSLPFPPKDPVFEAKRKGAEDAFGEVDLPYMLLRFRQGIGRLIRTSEDSGSISVLMSPEELETYAENLQSVLPVAPQTTTV
ncbi:ATP-dependent DNA helicase [Falsibacillus pallidus]|uniref:ATP-dependent DNA helicase DinG n=1 Tax=Falsibacillus pallidus TaxID=493781 RepID=A0A370GGX6_9BACI|nr:ATP-dependent DNA helicase [Falsibacillus pallidus]RDI43042.1 ATP-dependent DNA helicase DinG [Falsibacillus pallidus]